MKKIIIAIVFLLLPVLVSASTIPDGAIIKTADNPDVYIVKYNNEKQFRRLILNPQVFESYGHLKWENIKTVTATEMNSYKISNLVKVENDPKVLALAPNGDAGSKSWLNVVASDFIAVGGDWDSVYQINAVDASNYNIATDLTTRSQVQTFLISNILPSVALGSTLAPAITSTPTLSPKETYALNDYYPIIMSLSDNLGTIIKNSGHNNYNGYYSKPFSTNSLKIGDEIQIKVEASDPKNRPIFYLWDSTNADFRQKFNDTERGQLGNWTSSNEINYTITQETLKNSGELFRIVVSIKTEKENFRNSSSINNSWDDQIFIDYLLAIPLGQ